MNMGSFSIHVDPLSFLSTCFSVFRVQILHFDAMVIVFLISFSDYNASFKRLSPHYRVRYPERNQCCLFITVHYQSLKNSVEEMNE